VIIFTSFHFLGGELQQLSEVRDVFRHVSRGKIRFVIVLAMFILLSFACFSNISLSVPYAQGL
jgi:hypothetical protein